jgi:23S rRNA pseudouridine1911/1915/1917 synthase
MDRKPQIIFEDEHILVINKPSGMTVNRSETTRSEYTLQDWVEEYLGIKKIAYPSQTEEDSDIEKAFFSRSGIVHRIDKETSGILLIGKNLASFMALQAQFKARTVKKTYSALAHGKVVPKEGEINVPVGRLPWKRRHFGVVAGGRESKTLYKVIAYYQLPNKKKEILSLLEVNPVTGRTHQIRVHFQYLGHPLFADFLYAGRKTQREDRKLLSRVFLHADRISFHHPLTNNLLTFEAPLPSELRNILQLLKKINNDCSV